MLASIMMDVEDLITEESDDASLWIAQMIHEEGLTASFYVVGEKARLWERRGRQDVIEAFKKHDIGFHSTWHSIHPTTAEICQDKDFLSGIEALWEREREGWQDAEKIFGRPLHGWGRTGSSWGPSISGLMGRMGRCYVYSPVALNGYNAWWFTNCLQLTPQIGGYDDAYADDAQFESCLGDLESAMAGADASGAAFLGVFLGHPTKIVHQEFWDGVNFSSGANPPSDEWKRPRPKPAEALPTIQKNFRRMLRAITRSGHATVGTSDLVRRLCAHKPFMSQAELEDICGQMSREERVLFTRDFTAGEILCALCQAAQAPAKRYPRRANLGPNAMPPVAERTAFDAADIRAAAGQLSASLDETGCLPPAVSVQGAPVGIGTYAIALAKALLGADRVTAPAEMPYPLEAETVANDVNRQVPGWIIHPSDLKMETILLHTRLQCWTLKPAFPS
ncbi:MAG: hypothetical protein IT210_12130 [Armatimonadetes bacterium]|nr:hypothetical protein [Armatimonadota bacterium]